MRSRQMLERVVWSPERLEKDDVNWMDGCMHVDAWFIIKSGLHAPLFIRTLSSSKQE
jgi:hypothetical protein